MFAHYTDNICLSMEIHRSKKKNSKSKNIGFTSNHISIIEADDGMFIRSSQFVERFVWLYYKWIIGHEDFQLNLF